MSVPKLFLAKANNSESQFSISFQDIYNRVINKRCVKTKKQVNTLITLKRTQKNWTSMKSKHIALNKQYNKKTT